MKCKILIVDDDRLVLQGLGNQLEKQKHQVTTATSGEKAIKFLNKDSFDLVITDLVMDHIDGIEVLKKAKELHPATKVLILTGHGDKTSAIKALRLKADDYLLKPCHPEELNHRISIHLNQLKLQKELKKAVKTIQKTKELESIGTLASGIAHDFNNLLYVILGYISLEQDHLESESRLSENLKKAEKACFRAKKLANKLITFSKGGEPCKETISIENMIKNEVFFVFKNSAIELEFNIQKNIHPVKIDIAQIKQVVSNIASNAKNTMGDKGVFKICCENFSAPEEGFQSLTQGEYIKMSFTDQGEGIAKENITKIFDPYFSTMGMGNKKGQGLGLAICHSIITKHKGLITVESEVGKGTTFFLYLPANSTNSDTGIIIPEKQPITTKSPKQADTPTAKILLMDDEESIRLLMGQVLIRLGYDVTTCIEGNEAIEIYKKTMASKEPFDIAILDLVNQFGMGGQETMKKLLEIDPDAKGIVISGYADDPAITDFRAYGFSGFLTKPATLDTLNKVIIKVHSNGK